MSTQPNDIGLAKYDDVGDVANLNTQSKIIVNAINEVLVNAGSSVSDQVYVNGVNNKISGAGNVIYGDNNVVIGNNNTIVGDNLIVLGDEKQINSKPNFHLYNADPYSKTVYYDDYEFSDEINVGDTIILGIDISCMRCDDEGNCDWITLSMPPFITTVTSKGSGYFTYTDSPQAPQVPEGYNIDMSNGNGFAILKDEWKVLGNGSVTMGNLSSGQKSFSVNVANAKGYCSSALNGSTAEGNMSFSANYGRGLGTTSAALNSGVAYATYATSLNDSYAYGGYSTALNYGRTAGRPIRCISTNTSEGTITAASGENVSNLIGTYIIYRNRNSINPVIHSYLKVNNVIGQKIYIENFPQGGGEYEFVLMTDGYIFRVEEHYAYNLATGYGMAGNRYSQAHGLYTLAVHEGSVIYGKYGVTPENYSWNLANGTAYTSMSLAAKILQNGNMFIDGTYSSPCADYAEFFEWADGNPNNEDRVGYFVKLVNGKIKKATDFEGVLGITSGNPAILGDSGELHWNKKYIYDDFGRIQYHDVEIPEVNDKDGNVIEDARLEKQPILNPDYDPSLEYVSRKDRPEWSAVGVMGKLPVRDDGTANVGDVVRASNGGIATKSISNGYPVLKRISDNVILVWVR